MPNIILTEYLQYRAELRGFDLVEIERIIRHSGERYLDTETRRMVVVGRQHKQLVMIPYAHGRRQYYSRYYTRCYTTANPFSSANREIYK